MIWTETRGKISMDVDDDFIKYVLNVSKAGWYHSMAQDFFIKAVTL